MPFVCLLWENVYSGPLPSFFSICLAAPSQSPHASLLLSFTSKTQKPYLHLWALSQIPASPSHLQILATPTLTSLPSIFLNKLLILEQLEIHRKITKIVQRVPICPMPSFLYFQRSNEVPCSYSLEPTLHPFASSYPIIYLYSASFPHGLWHCSG